MGVCCEAACYQAEDDNIIEVVKWFRKAAEQGQRLFAYGEMVCFPMSVGVVGVVALHSLLVLLLPLLAKVGIALAIATVLPSLFTAIFVSAAIGYPTSYVAIQMLYYPVDATDLGIVACGGVRTRALPVGKTPHRNGRRCSRAGCCPQ